MCEEPTRDGGAEDLQSFSPEAVSQGVNDLVTQTLEFYTDSEEFQVQDDREDGSGTVQVLISENLGGEKPHYQLYQKIEYNDGVVIGVSSDWEGKWYTYDQERQEVHIWDSSVSSANRHSINCIISSEKQLLTEFTWIQSGTSLMVEYRPTMQGGIQGFQFRKALCSGLWLSPEDVEKFLQGGRFIPLSRLLQFVINPAKRYPINTQRVCAIDRADNFLKLEYLDARHHGRMSITTLDRNYDKIHGFAHPLEGDPDGWLVFARFRDGESAKGRALIVKVDRESIQVQDIEGTPTINVQVSVDGELFQLAIPEVCGRWEEATAGNLGIALETYIDKNSGIITRVFRQTTAEELVAMIEQGYYFGEMLNAALETYYEKYYAKDGSDL